MENRNSQDNAVYLLLMHSGTMPSKLVRLTTRFRYSHTALSLTRDCSETYSFGRKSVHNFLNGGFVREERHGLFYTKFNQTFCCVYRIPVTDAQRTALMEILADFTEHERLYKYDFLGAGMRFVKIPISFSRKYVCSSFVAYTLQNAGIYRFSKPIYMVKPKDLTSIPDSEIIYEGLYQDMNL